MSAPSPGGLPPAETAARDAKSAGGKGTKGKSKAKDTTTEETGRFRDGDPRYWSEQKGGRGSWWDGRYEESTWPAASAAPPIISVPAWSDAKGRRSRAPAEAEADTPGTVAQQPTALPKQQAGSSAQQTVAPTAAQQPTALPKQQAGSSAQQPTALPFNHLIKHLKEWRMIPHFILNSTVPDAIQQYMVDVLHFAGNKPRFAVKAVVYQPIITEMKTYQVLYSLPEVHRGADRRQGPEIVGRARGDPRPHRGKGADAKRDLGGFGILKHIWGITLLQEWERTHAATVGENVAEGYNWMLWASIITIFIGLITFQYRGFMWNKFKDVCRRIAGVSTPPPIIRMHLAPDVHGIVHQTWVENGRTWLKLEMIPIDARELSAGQTDITDNIDDLIGRRTNNIQFGRLTRAAHVPGRALYGARSQAARLATPPASEAPEHGEEETPAEASDMSSEFASNLYSLGDPTDLCETCGRRPAFEGTYPECISCYQEH